MERNCSVRVLRNGTPVRKIANLSEHEAKAFVATYEACGGKAFVCYPKSRAMRVAKAASCSA